MINYKHELYGSCQCNTRFHWFCRTNTGTDEGFNLEKNDCDDYLVDPNDICGLTEDDTDRSTDSAFNE